jgi:hypothetical protein
MLGGSVRQSQAQAQVVVIDAAMLHVPFFGPVGTVAGSRVEAITAVRCRPGRRPDKPVPKPIRCAEFWRKSLLEQDRSGASSRKD